MCLPTPPSWFSGFILENTCGTQREAPIGKDRKHLHSDGKGWRSDWDCRCFSEGLGGNFLINEVHESTHMYFSLPST